MALLAVFPFNRGTMNQSLERVVQVDLDYVDGKAIYNPDHDGTITVALTRSRGKRPSTELILMRLKKVLVP